jgi:hypothetical protein
MLLFAPNIFTARAISPLVEDAPVTISAMDGMHAGHIELLLQAKNEPATLKRWRTRGGSQARSLFTLEFELGSRYVLSL